MKIIFSGLIIFLLIGCKSKQSVATAAANNSIEVSNIIQGHYNNAYDFKTLQIRANAKYEDATQSHSLSTEIRIKKDEIIWINIKILGFPIAKALITPTKVSYYEKINSTYFEGDFSKLSNWLGTDLDFSKVQNLFLGKALDDLTKEQLVVEINEKLFKLSKPTQTDLSKTFYFEAANYLLTKEIIEQASQNRALAIQYPSYQKVAQMFVPNEINIKAAQKEKISIDIAYKNTIVNEHLSYSYSVPNDYKPIEID